MKKGLTVLLVVLLASGVMTAASAETYQVGSLIVEAPNWTVMEKSEETVNALMAYINDDIGVMFTVRKLEQDEILSFLLLDFDKHAESIAEMILNASGYHGALKKAVAGNVGGYKTVYWWADVEGLGTVDFLYSFTITEMILITYFNSINPPSGEQEYRINTLLENWLQSPEELKTGFQEHE